MGNQKEEIGVEVAPEPVKVQCPACECTLRIHKVAGLPVTYHASCCFCDWTLSLDERTKPEDPVTQAEADATLAGEKVTKARQEK